MSSQVSERRFDLSRDTFEATNLYRSIIKQQGRVTVDADDNEQRRIELHRGDLTTLDVIGACGYPQGGTGFQIGVAATNQTLTVGTGRIYVAGLLAENFTATPQLLLDSPTAGAPPAFLTVSGGTYSSLPAGTYLAYLDVWERDVIALDAPAIRETALGGPDTAARTQLVAQVHLTATTLGATCATATLPALPAHTGTLTAGVDPAAAAADCTLPPLAGFRGAENQLYRVEIQQSGAPGTATFKWSRENGSVVTGITGPASGPIGLSFTVQSVGVDSTLGFANNQWVELIDDTYVFTGQPGVLALISKVDPSTLTVTLTAGSPSGVISYQNNPKMRRWEQPPATAAAGVTTATTPLDLENGVQVSFGGSMLYAGDYWMIPARTAINEETGTLNYPTTPQAALYTRHNRCALAVITYDMTSGWGAPADCRIPFPPLTGLPTGGGCCTTVTVGDGKTSIGQYSDIGAAVAALGTAGGVVGIEAGSYTIASPVVVPGSVTLRGCPGRTFIEAPAGAFIVNGDGVTIEGLTIRIATAAAVATAAGNSVVQLALINNVVRATERQQQAEGGAAAYAFSFSAAGVRVVDNALRFCGIEVQPVSAGVTILRNGIIAATGRGISLGSSTAAAPGSSGGSGGVYVYEYFGTADAFTKATANFSATASLASISGVEIADNTILRSALEGVGAETLVTPPGGTQQLIVCSDVAIRGNTIAACLANPTGNLAASAAILLPFVERMRVLDNLIEANGLTLPASGIASFVAQGCEIRENRIYQNGAGASANAYYGLAAIDIIIAIPGDLAPGSAGDILLPAAIVSDNVVTSQNAAALYLLAAGQVSVTNNDFTVVGFVDNPNAIGQTVRIIDAGSGAQELVASSPSLANLGFIAAPSQNYTTDADVTGGQVVFAGNRCLYDGRDTGETAICSVLIQSGDAVIIEGNVSRAFVLASGPNGTAGLLITNLLAEATIAQVSGNRLSEDSAYASALVVGGDTLGIGNHGTHCLYFEAAGTNVDEPNIVNALNADNCPSIRLFGN